MAANFDGLRFSHWQTELRADGIVVLAFDRHGASVNAFSQDVLIELADILERLTIDPPKGVVLRSAKASGFIAGADLKEFQEFDRKGTVNDAIRRGQAVFQKLAELPCPTVAAIHGFCMGGGTEISLACDYRVASSDPSTRIGLPEVKLGIFPGWGGSARLPRLVGAPKAMDMMLTGRTYNAEEGERVGLAQYLVPAGTALDKALALAARIATKAPLTNYALTHTLPRIAEQPGDHGLMTEALIAAIAQAAPEAKTRVRAFLDGKAAKVKPT